MSKIAGVGALALVASLAGMTALRAQNPVPPVKPGLWETKMSQLDANGKEVPAPGMEAFAKMTPAARAQMAEMMKARGVQMPDEHGAMKACLTKDSLDSGAWQQVANEAGCTTNYSQRSGSMWKWHTSCTSIKSESDGEMTFTGAEAYRTTMRTTATVGGKTTTTTRIVEGKWLGANCGDIKPLVAPKRPGQE